MLRPASDLPHAARLAAANWWVQHKDHVARLIASRDDPGTAYPPSGSDVWHPELWTAPHWIWLDQVTADGV